MNPGIFIVGIVAALVLGLVVGPRLKEWWEDTKLLREFERAVKEQDMKLFIAMAVEQHSWGSTLKTLAFCPNAASLLGLHKIRATSGLKLVCLEEFSPWDPFHVAAVVMALEQVSREEQAVQKGGTRQTMPLPPRGVLKMALGERSVQLRNVLLTHMEGSPESGTLLDKRTLRV